MPPPHHTTAPGHVPPPHHTTAPGYAPPHHTTAPGYAPPHHTTAPGYAPTAGHATATGYVATNHSNSCKLQAYEHAEASIEAALAKDPRSVELHSKLQKMRAAVAAERKRCQNHDARLKLVRNAHARAEQHQFETQRVHHMQMARQAEIVTKHHELAYRDKKLNYKHKKAEYWRQSGIGGYALGGLGVLAAIGGVLVLVLKH